VARLNKRRDRRPRDLDIVYEDDALIVVNKPAGILSVRLERNPGVPSVSEQLAERFRSHGKKRPLVVHRIDQDTTGLVVFAKDERTRKALMDQFRRREPERVYLAIAEGHPAPARGTWRDRLVWDPKALIQRVARAGEPTAQEAISDYQVVEQLRGASLLEVQLRTGRRNQIRIQAAVRGHSLIGERRYVAADVQQRAIRFGRQALHAWRLVFQHPWTGDPVVLEAPMPPDFVDLLTRLRPRGIQSAKR
jgi:23S rRNA pseudouridine1911/1915/1917 synthase